MRAGLESPKMPKTSATNAVGLQNVYDKIIRADIKFEERELRTGH